MSRSHARRTELDAVHLHLATLHRPGLARSLVRRLGSVAGVLRAPSDVLRSTDGMTPAVLRKLRRAATRDAAEREVETAAREGVTVLMGDGGATNYPPELCELDAMPLVLFARGEADAVDALGAPSPRVGIVGSRRPSLYALGQARRFASALAGAGVEVVSGLARGVDAAAHEATIDAGGRTIAVLGCGLGTVYPREHTRLIERLLERGGLVLSEFPHSAPPRSFHFPLRNRLLSALSTSVLVVEAGTRSGSLITVHHALEQGRSVHALPGRVDRPGALGGLRLLQDGAFVAIDPADVIAELGVLPATALRNGAAESQESEEPLGGGLDALFDEEDAWHPDGLAERLRMPVIGIMEALSRLELEGRVRRVAGGRFARVRRRDA